MPVWLWLNSSPPPLSPPFSCSSSVLSSKLVKCSEGPIADEDESEDEEEEEKEKEGGVWRVAMEGERKEETVLLRTGVRSPGEARPWRVVERALRRVTEEKEDEVVAEEEVEAEADEVEALRFICSACPRKEELSADNWNKMQNNVKN